MKPIYYLGNQNLKNIGQPVEFTKDNVEEYIRCSQDPIYFIRNYVKITTIDHGLVPFTLYPYQEDFINNLHNNRFVLGMFPRQFGKTQTVTAYILWYTLFNSDKTVAILANKGAAAREVLSRYQDMYEGLPKWIQQGIRTWNKGNIELENRSKIFTSATSPNACRGKSISLLYVDESAFISNVMAEGFFTSVYPTISSGKTSKIIQTSTPMGYNHWWKFWTEAEKGTNNFIPFRVTWDMMPGRTIEWYNEQVKILGPIKASQEVDCNFLGSSYTLINAATLSRLQPSPPLKVTEYGLTVLEEPKQDRTYVMVVDTSEGVGGDYSAFTVIDVTELPYTVVAKFRNNSISPLLYPSVILGAAKSYNNAFLLMEINRSEQVAYIVHHEMEYENILFVTKGKHGQVVSSGFGGLKPNYGVSTDKKVKRIGCNNLKTLIEENKLLITDVDIISEISTFVEHRGSYKADEGYHDDLIMTLVLFGWLTTQEYFKDLTNINLRKALLEMKQREIDEQVIPIGHIISGKEAEPLGIVMDGDYWVFAEPKEFLE